MEKKWKNWLKKAGVLLLLIAILAQTTESYVYAEAGLAMEGPKEITEEKEKLEITGEAGGGDQNPIEEKWDENAEEDTIEENNTKEGNTDSRDLEEIDQTIEDPSEEESSALSQEENKGERTQEESEPKTSQAQKSQEQYHFQEGNVESIQQWMKTYLPNGYEDILSMEEEWWEALYEYERDLATFIRDSIVELDPNVYHGQELGVILSILEQGISTSAFFEGTIFEPLEIFELKGLKEAGWNLEDVYEFLMVYFEGNVENQIYEAWQTVETEEEEEKFQSLLQAVEKILIGMEIVQTYSASAGVLEEGDTVANLSVSATGYSGTGHGTIYKLTLGGQPALCLRMGKSARNGYKYFAGEGEYERRQDGIGYLLGYASLSGRYYATVQIAAWLYLSSTSLSQSQVISRAASMLNTSAEEASDMAGMVWTYYQGARNHSTPYWVYHSPNGNAQTAGTIGKPSTTTYQPGTGGEGPEEPELPPVEPEFSSIEDSITVSYQVQLRKADWQTGVGLGGCVIDIFENGAKVNTVTTDVKGEASWQTSKSASFQAEYCSNYEDLTPEQQAQIEGPTSRGEAQAELDAQKSAFAGTSYTYSIREVTAPRGYVWEANEGSKSIQGNGTATLNLTNERTLGSVELIKYDTESESSTVQGDGSLEGAEYGIYAAENILHGDGKTGILFRKDALVAKAIIGQSPKRSSEGYILNTDGTRHIANPRGTIAYEKTPGKTVFGDLELGSYYIRELTPPKGYMLDEARYPVTFTYKNQMTKVEVRNEQAKEVENQLTVDDESTSHTIYSGDYVIKQGVQFTKTSDNGFETELSALEGAGFSVYRIHELSKVKDGTLVPVNDTWGEDDISTFYEYDFTNEPRAMLYKRTNQEQWTTGDKKWLVPMGGKNQYQVAEMFTDKEGHIETPELPFGTYVIVETTTPEHHVMARPFIVHITQDGGVLYTDIQKQTIERTYTPEEGIRYGDHRETKEREGRVLQKQRIINNVITTAYLRIVKADEEFLIQPGTYIKAEELVRGTVLKEGARYRLRCLSRELSDKSLKTLNWRLDAEGYLSFYSPGEKKLIGTEAHPFITSFLRKNGKITDCYITLPRELPVGTYELTELKAPEGYVVNGKEQAVKDTSVEGSNGFELVDTPKGKTIFTIENGSVYPDGQMGVSKYAVCDSYGNLTVTVLQKNQEQKGIIELYKHGEQLSGAGEDTKTLLDKLATEPFRYLKLEEIAQHKDVVFAYEDAPVEGASFQIVAAEDIYSQELDLDLVEQYEIEAERYRIWKKGDVVAEITTDRNGYAYAAGLYIGKYKIRETVAGTGFVLNTTEEEFSITPQKQTISFDIKSVDYKNERQRLKLEAIKKDKESGKSLAGAVFGLYAGEDIRTGIVYSEEKEAWVLREELEVLFPKGALIATCVTDMEGKAAFDEDLPLGQYEVRELEAPIGYLQSEEVLPVDGNYEGEKGGQEVAVQEHQVVMENLITKVRFQKLDMTNGRELAGALLEVWELPMTEEELRWKKAGLEEKVEIKKDSWISTGPARTVHMTEGLQLGRIYAFREAKPAPGYVTAADIYFQLEQLRDEENRLTDQIGVYLVEQLGKASAVFEGQEDTSSETEEKEEIDTGEDLDHEPILQEVLEMEDDVTKVQISKKDITTKEELPGASLELYDENGVLLEAWVSTDTPHYIERLPIGTYRLVETKAPEGFGCAEDVVFQVLDTDELQTVEMLDDLEKEKPPKEPTPEETPEKPRKEEHPSGGSESPEEESNPQEVNTPELGDRSQIGNYLLILLLLLAAIAAVIFQYKRDVEE